MAGSLDASTTEALIARILRIAEDQKPLWGKMTAQEMVTYCSTAVKLAFGDIPAKPRMGPVQATLARWLFVDLFPFPKNSPTAPELDPAKKLAVSGAYDAARQELVSQLRRLQQAPSDHVFAKHPLFLQMSRQQWGKLMQKHMDHHLRQFGV